MTKEKIPSTPAIRFLIKNSVDFTPCPYKYEDRGGTKVASRELKCDEHQMVKTLVMEDEYKNPLIILMHGDMQVSTKKLARTIETKSVIPCDPKTAQKHTGYLVGGTSPLWNKDRYANIYGRKHHRPSKYVHKRRAQGSSRRNATDGDCKDS